MRLLPEQQIVVTVSLCSRFTRRWMLIAFVTSKSIIQEPGSWTSTCKPQSIVTNITMAIQSLLVVV